ncbi:DUF881 domain-containing protein [Fictibacillus sp. WQ 8-8]|uniref:DUF881 domain-containing protein n=1 Tax=unclassified Fictibacillus TaxID=2644029 RepID=UPI0006A7A4AB|nr:MULTISPECIES: DUF881 domain-containing protein [unclassified Fictibacillus]MCQ6265704.1 DUF881 domain-containing protein [Fictibacillus sp. WQ 8-8]MED2973414.1 DUF881 domain-containing protein [Fictibacillus sp. B-59209]SFD85788.1 Uncharacterized conserved protein YlxW, UPF0749 family [Bacillus sp. OV194]
MNNKRKAIFAGVACILGVMLAIQFQTTNNPITRDTRDTWELRADLEKEKQRQQDLNNEIKKYQDLLDDYEQSRKKEKTEAMEKALNDLKEAAGLTEVSGQGILITIEPFNEGEAPKLYPELIRRLINELNRYEAKDISVDGQRIISTTPIREVNGETYINNQPLGSFPIEIKVLSDDAQKLQNKIIASQSAEDFVRENLYIDSKPQNQLTLPAYDKPIRVKYMKQAKEEL